MREVDYRRQTKLYEKELYKIIRKQMPDSPEHDINRIFDGKIKELKSKYKQ